MTEPNFNLVDEPWIRVRLCDGRSDTVSLRALFHRCTEIRRIAGELPTQDFAILRIALAVMYRTLGTDEEIHDVWTSGSLPLDRIDEYLDQWHDRFDLFHPTQPFMQVAGLRSTSGDTKPLGILIPDSPGDDSLFTMRRDVASLPFAEAARWLVHCQAYDFDGIKTGAADDPRTKGGRGYPIGIGWAGWLGGLYLEGRDLRETLLHNWVPDNDHLQRDRALWELEPLTPEPRPASAIGPFGPAGLFTWPIRHIRLFADGDQVTRVLICVGDPIAKAFQYGIEPMTSWRYSDPQTKKEKSQTPLYMPRAHSQERSLWRGLTALLPSPRPQQDKNGVVLAHPSTIVARLGERVSIGDIPNSLVDVVSVGVEYGAQMSSYSEIFTDSLVVYPAIADPEGSSYACVIDAVKRADDAVSALARLAGDLAVADGGEPAGAASAARSAAYAALDPRFRDWIRFVDNDRDSEELSQAWYGLARDALSDLADQLLDSATPRSRAVRTVDGRQVSAGTSANWFRYNLLKHLPDARKDHAK
ncbi:MULTISPECIES: type I-E CRISPR-associated protein Cse1/CasA [Gordonia]|uniref:Putative CRISPR-associated protein n=1 Tax=Gordonia sihwensis NBRC 108236 TaxID=1223544 RepID=L7LKW9_9ACTN|nr:MULTISPECIES: type I-E CRISPR-associated protein Cse1/CasA [Gordonia]AUH69600.1 type I-E CRISPR-associated protein Cse1/CasA [Gordonia sp. YC-JH1]MBY4570213.1 type I-E CRISPR-associated protein Cse1/CasA [Gordonia sihwensis]GAC61795.1 putative CRISPR-associated protein [Gordonia sihwensis NBRC 108236]